MAYEKKKTGRKHTFVFDLLSLDVWGNKRDGFEINDVHRSGQTLEVPAEQWEFNVETPHAFKSWHIEDADVVRALKDHGYLKKTVRTKRIEIDTGGNSFLETRVSINDAKTGEPLWQIELPYGTEVPE